MGPTSRPGIGPIGRAPQEMKIGRYTFPESAQLKRLAGSDWLEDTKGKLRKSTHLEARGGEVGHHGAGPGMVREEWGRVGGQHSVPLHDPAAQGWGRAAVDGCRVHMMNHQVGE